MNPVARKRVLSKAAYNPRSTAWYEAGYGITLNGSAVSSWLDKSGNGYTASQGTATKQPAFTASGINSKPSITYTAAASPNGDFLSANELTTLFTGNDMPFSFSCVLYVTGGLAGLPVIVSFSATSNTRSYFYVGLNATGKLLFGKASNASPEITATGASNLSLNTPYVVSVTYTGTNISAWLNGVLEINNASVDATTTDVTKFNVGAFFGATEINHFAGQIPEVIIYNSAIDTVRRQANENYLRLKYNVY